MGGSSVPSSTSQYQQVATGIWGSPQATKLALPILKPALANIKNQQDMLMGFQKGDPEQTRKFFGLSADAPAEEAVHAIGQLNKPVTSQVQYQPTKTAAHGGIMDLEDEPANDPRKFAKGGLTADAASFLVDKINKGGKISKDYQKQLDAYIKANPDSAAAQMQAQNTADTTAIQSAARQAGLAPSQAYINQAGYFGFDPDAYRAAIERGDLAGTTTNPLYAQAIRQLQAMEKQPEQFGQATQAYQDAISGLKGAAQYQPERVTGAKINRGDVREVAAQMANVERYRATPIERTRRERAAQTAGAQSWTQPGTAEQYMNPYVETALESQQRLANRQFAQQQNQLRSQAAQQKAFGGSRAALAEQNAQLNQNIANQNLAAQGLTQAYGQGMGQFQQEQQLGAQIGLANTQAINALKSQYMQMGLTEAQANQAAINTASQTNAAAQNQAYNNYVAQALQAQMANQQADLGVTQQNAQLVQQANLANQQAGLQANQQNIGAYGQIGSMGQGLGALGTQVGNYGQNIANMWGQAGGTLQGLGQNWYNQQTQNAGNLWGGPSSLANQGMGILGSMGGGQSGNVLQSSKQG